MSTSGGFDCFTQPLFTDFSFGFHSSPNHCFTSFIPPLQQLQFHLPPTTNHQPPTTNHRLRRPLLLLSLSPLLALSLFLCQTPTVLCLILFALAVFRSGLRVVFSGDFIIKMPMLTAPSTIVSSPLLPAAAPRKLSEKIICKAGDLQSTELPDVHSTVEGSKSKLIYRVMKLDFLEFDIDMGIESFQFRIMLFIVC
ncbi:unnamed protein product [Prunus armeniaca]|uniref:Uncharacterized protein n=1 Tax=Prunus armeniaca TaxID=36596 RepID=A0A6J5TXI9_PRUAR|nr:unnamed protein product [Prunus armeniaca]CAB4299267.1 unnamed protein product [Prunus armeniaca]